MKIGSVCNSCFQLYSLVIEPEDAALLASFTEKKGTLAPCPRLCGGKINTVMVRELKIPKKSRLYREPIEITVKELHAAIFGNGLPDEIPKDRTVVEAMLFTHPIVGTVFTNHGGNEVYIESILLKNGVRIHLAGGVGARVVKLTKDKEV